MLLVITLGFLAPYFIYAKVTNNKPKSKLFPLMKLNKNLIKLNRMLHVKRSKSHIKQYI